MAERLLRCIADGPRGRVTDFGGPEVLSFKDAAAQWQEARQVRKPIVRSVRTDGQGAPSRQGHGAAGRPGTGFLAGMAHGDAGQLMESASSFQFPASRFSDPESRVPSPESRNRPC